MKKNAFWVIVIVMMSVIIGMSFGPREALAKDNSIMVVAQNEEVKNQLYKLGTNMKWLGENHRAGRSDFRRMKYQLLRQRADGKYVYCVKYITSDNTVAYETYIMSGDELTEMNDTVIGLRNGHEYEF